MVPRPNFKNVYCIVSWMKVMDVYYTMIKLIDVILITYWWKLWMLWHDNYEGDAFICEVIDSGHFVWTRGH